MRDTRRRALEALCKSAPLTVAELAIELGVTRTAAVSHLRSLQSEGIAHRAGFRAGLRRPSALYKLTDDADRLFSHEYDTLAIGMIEELKRTNGRKLKSAIDQLAHRWIARDAATIKRAKSKSRVATALAIVSDRGLMPTLERSGRGYLLRHAHCPLQRVGAAHPVVCTIIERWIGSLFGRSIKRTACTSMGDPYCGYAIGNPRVSHGRQPD